jgi:hypothetical protein
MNNKKGIRQVFVIGLAIFLIAVLLSGCTENNNSNDEAVSDKFIATWIGNLVSTFKGHTANITELTFLGNTVDVTMKSDRGTNTMTYIYNVEGDKLILEAKFDNGGPQGDRQPPEGGQPSLSISFVYSFNEEYDVLFLDGSEFIKAN